MAVQALELAEESLGRDLLFPDQVLVKEPQVVLGESQQPLLSRENKVVATADLRRVEGRQEEGGRKRLPFMKLGKDVNRNNLVEVEVTVGSDNEVVTRSTNTPRLSTSKEPSLLHCVSAGSPPICLATIREEDSPESPSTTAPPRDLRARAIMSKQHLLVLHSKPPIFSAPHLHALPRPTASLSSLLPHPFHPPMTPYHRPPSTVHWVNKRLNPEQQQGVISILQGVVRPLPHIIHGPPGTGKTVTLVEAALQLFLLRPDSRLLVVAPSNSAADLVAQRLLASGRLQLGDLARLNSFQRRPDSVPISLQPLSFRNDEQEDVLRSSRHRIVVSTASTSGVLGSLGLRLGHFSHLLVDEAGHLTEPELLVPLVLVGRQAQLVLAGDWLQLGPTLVSRPAEIYGLGVSFLERLATSPLYLGHDQRLVTRLVTNYRSHPDILAVPSRLFYSSSLLAGSPLSLQRRYCGSCLGSLLPSPDHPVVFHAVSGQQLQEGSSPSWYNPQEVWQVGLYVQWLQERGVAPADMGIIAPYRQQVAKVREMLETLQLEAGGLTVGSVEEFQGQERPVIILTTVRSSSSHAAADLRQGLGFLASGKRFNVAVTRAQSLLVVVGDPRVILMVCSECQHVVQVLGQDPVWREFLQHVTSLGGWRGELACVLPGGAGPGDGLGSHFSLSI